MATKRHAKPTAAALANRMYRQQLAHHKDVETHIDETRSALAMLSQRMESFRVLADHCARLLREKETLQKQIELKANPPEKFAPRPEHEQFDGEKFADFDANGHTRVSLVKYWPLKHLHTTGIKCEICGDVS